MLTPLTQTAISILHDIEHGVIVGNTPQYVFFQNTVSELLLKLEAGGLIRCKDTEHPAEPASYELNCPYYEISLLQLLEALGEHLNCNHPTQESMYQHYRAGALRLGVINHMTRLYLSEIKLIDLV